MDWKNKNSWFKLFSRYSYFVDNYGTENYFVFQSIFKYFKRVSNTDCVLEWKSKGLCDESIKFLSVPNNFLDPSL